MIPTITPMRPRAKVTLPHQSIFAGRRSPSSRSDLYDQMVATTPTGTETRNTARQLTGASKPPSTSPMNEPAIAAMLLTPSASPRWFLGKASVRIALEFAKRSAPPTPWPTRIRISQSAAVVPCIHVSERRTENAVKTAKPRLNIRTRPYMSPRRPRLTISTAITTGKPRISQSR